MPAKADKPVSTDWAAPLTRQIGKPHGRLRCVNVCLTTESAVRLREFTALRHLTLGEALMEVVTAAMVPGRTLRQGRQPAPRRQMSTANVYVLLTAAEATELRDRAANAGRTISDYADLAIAGAALNTAE